MTDIAVVIPSYNAERFLAEALDSVLAQSRPVARVVVVDDGSVDGSVALAEGYAARGLPVACLLTPVNGGPGTARNLGMRAVSEPFVAFLDADDFWASNHCEVLAQLLERHGDAVLAYSDADTTGGVSSGPDVRVRAEHPTDVEMLLAYDNPITQSAAMVRRDAFMRAGGYVDGMRYSEDYDLWLRLAELGPVVASGATTCTRRLHDGQATHQASKMYRGAWEGRYRMRERRAGRLDASALAQLDATLASAFDRDLTWAWQSRSRRLVSDVLGLADGVPFLAPVALRWQRRLRFVWPVWRMAAGVWDATPASLRARLRHLRPRARRIGAIATAPGSEETA